MSPSEQIEARAKELFRQAGGNASPNPPVEWKVAAILEYLDCLEQPLVDAGVIAAPPRGAQK